MDNKLKCVGRLKRNCYMYNGKLVSQTTFTLLKRKSQLSLEDYIVDAEVDIDKLELSNYDDGVYEIVLTNPSRDWETGIIDDWDLKLIPYEEEK